MEKFNVYRLFLENGQIEKYYWDTYDNRDTANKVAAELKAEKACDYAIVEEIEA